MPGLSYEMVTRFKSATEEEARAEFLKRTRKKLGQLQKTGQASTAYNRYVDGVEDAPEESVRVPGAIEYHFHWMSSILSFAIGYMRRRWPVLGPGRGGHWRDAWLIMSRGVEIKLEDADKYDSVQLTNTKPYSRKAQIGYKGFSMSKDMFTDCEVALKNEFGARNYIFRVQFYELAGGYIVKHSKKAKKMQARGLAGEPMRYPSLLMERKA